MERKICRTLHTSSRRKYLWSVSEPGLPDDSAHSKSERLGHVNSDITSKWMEQMLQSVFSSCQGAWQLGERRMGSVCSDAALGS